MLRPWCSITMAPAKMVCCFGMDEEKKCKMLCEDGNEEHDERSRLSSSYVFQSYMVRGYGVQFPRPLKKRETAWTRWTLRWFPEEWFGQRMCSRCELRKGDKSKNSRLGFCRRREVCSGGGGIGFSGLTNQNLELDPSSIICGVACAPASSATG